MNAVIQKTGEIITQNDAAKSRNPEVVATGTEEATVRTNKSEIQELKDMQLVIQ